MKRTRKKIVALMLACVLCATLAACSGEDTASTSGGTTSNDDVVTVTNEGSVSLPGELVAPETAGTMSTFISGGTLYGSFLLINYRTTDYFTSSGSLTLTINSSLFSLKDDAYIPQETKYKEATVALWKRGDGNATFVETAYFKADGTAYTASFDGLDSAAEYRIGITYSDVARYRMTGSFSLAGVTSEQPAGTDATDSSQSTPKSGKKQ